MNLKQVHKRRHGGKPLATDSKASVGWFNGVDDPRVGISIYGEYTFTLSGDLAEMEELAERIKATVERARGHQARYLPQAQ